MDTPPSVRPPIAVMVRTDYDFEDPVRRVVLMLVDMTGIAKEKVDAIVADMTFSGPFDLQLQGHSLDPFLMVTMIYDPQETTEAEEGLVDNGMAVGIAKIQQCFKKVLGVTPEPAELNTLLERHPELYTATGEAVTLTSLGTARLLLNDKPFHVLLLRLLDDQHVPYFDGLYVAETDACRVNGEYEYVTAIGVFALEGFSYDTSEGRQALTDEVLRRLFAYPPVEDLDFPVHDGELGTLL